MSKVFLILAAGSAVAGFVFRKQLREFAQGVASDLQEAIIQQAMKEQETFHLSENDR